MSNEFNNNNTPTTKAILQQPKLPIQAQTHDIFSPRLSLNRSPVERVSEKDKKENQAVTSPEVTSPVSNTALKQTGTPHVLDKVMTKDEDKKWVKEVLALRRGDLTRLEYAIIITEKLNTFMGGKKNMHTDATLIAKKALQEVKKIRFQVEDLEKALAEKEKELLTLRNDLEKSNMVNNNKKRNRTETSPEQTEKTGSPKRAKNREKDKSFTPIKETPRTSEARKPEWQKVPPRRKEKKPPQPEKPKAPRLIRKKSDALVISSKDASSYADILRKMKADPTLKDMGEKITRVRRTRNGEILFEFKPDESAKSAVFKTLVEKVVGEEASVKALSQEVLMECRNLDEITTTDELHKALVSEFSSEDPQSIGIIKLRKAYGSTQIGSFRVPVAVANKMTEAGKVKVGWSICQLRVPQQLLRCYKCLGFDHLAKQCKGVDHSKLCWKCGIEGHKGRTCNNNPKCVLCKENEGNDHQTGSFKCKAYKEAAEKRGWK